MSWLSGSLSEVTLIDLLSICFVWYLCRIKFVWFVYVLHYIRFIKFVVQSFLWVISVLNFRFYLLNMKYLSSKFVISILYCTLYSTYVLFLWMWFICREFPSDSWMTQELPGTSVCLVLRFQIGPQYSCFCKYYKSWMLQWIYSTELCKWLIVHCRTVYFVLLLYSIIVLIILVVYALCMLTGQCAARQLPLIVTASFVMKTLLQCMWSLTWFLFRLTL